MTLRLWKLHSLKHIGALQRARSFDVASRSTLLSHICRGNCSPQRYKPREYQLGIVVLGNSFQEGLAGDAHWDE